MNNAGLIEAFRSYYQQAKDSYNAGDFSQSHDLFVKAATLANKISVETKSYDVKMEYHTLADRILYFLKNDFNKKTVQVNDEPSNEKHSFDAVDTSEIGNVTFSDVAGLEDVKEEIIYNVIEPLRDPELAKTYNIKPGAKILLYGPPGTGKTFIARAIAGEIDAKFYSVNCQDLISKYMGESSKQIDSLFEEAQKNKRAIIFFDEIDSIAPKRGSGYSVDGEMSRFVASFLVKVDGFKKPKDCEMLLIIAATNRPWAIDPAMLRGGRLDIQIYVGLPDAASRHFLVEKELKDIKLLGFTTNDLVDSLNGFGGADVVACCRKIKQLAYRRATKTKCIEPITIEDARSVIANLHPTISHEELDKFENFKKGQI